MNLKTGERLVSDARSLSRTMSEPSPLTQRTRRLQRVSALLLICVLFCALILSSCFGQSGVKAATTAGSERTPSTLNPTISAAYDAGTTKDGVGELSAQVERQLSSMTLEEKVAQLFIVRPESITGADVVIEAGQMTESALSDYPVGGFIYFDVNLVDADQTRKMLSTTQQISKKNGGLPLFLCVDEEGGTVSRVGGNEGFSIANQGNMRDIGDAGDTDEAFNVARTIGSYLEDLGFNVDFAPVADIANGTSGTMALRSFGESAKSVAPMVAAQVRGFTDAGILCCAKHFPGIGDVEGDSHDSAIYSNKTLDELNKDELIPFQAAIEESVPFIMVGHLDLPSLMAVDVPASLSSEIMTDLLRTRMRYQGIVITDSLGMGAICERYEPGNAAVMAIEAGADMLLMPPDFYEAYTHVLDAVKSGEIPESHIDDSVRRIVRAKLVL